MVMRVYSVLEELFLGQENSFLWSADCSIGGQATQEAIKAIVFKWADEPSELRTRYRWGSVQCGLCGGTDIILKFFADNDDEKTVVQNIGILEKPLIPFLSGRLSQIMAEVIVPGKTAFKWGFQEDVMEWRELLFSYFAVHCYFVERD